MIEFFFKIGLPVLMIGIATLVSPRHGPAMGGILGAVPAQGGSNPALPCARADTSFAATSSAAASLDGAGSALRARRSRAEATAEASADLVLAEAAE